MIQLNTFKGVEAVQKFIDKKGLEFNDGQPTVLETVKLLKHLYGDQKDISGNLKSNHMLRIFAHLPDIKENSRGMSETQIARLRKDRAIIALLHDAFEDQKITEKNLRRLGYSDMVIECIKKLTHEEYPKGADQIEKNVLYEMHVDELIDLGKSKSREDKEMAARIVPIKLLDNVDNLSKVRLEKLEVPSRAKREQKYNRTIKSLKKACEQFVSPDEWGFTARNYINRSLEKYNEKLVC